MKVNIRECKELKKHTIDCLLNTYMGKDKVDKVLEYWENSNTIKQFKNKVLSDESLKMTQGYAELSKETEEHWMRVEKMFGEKTFKTYSDAGSVKIGCDKLSILISNGYGDGSTMCAVFDNEDKLNFNDDMMSYTGIVLRGEINIYDYDCGNDIIYTMIGKYFVYTYEGLVAFVECVE